MTIKKESLTGYQPSNILGDNYDGPVPKSLIFEPSPRPLRRLTDNHNFDGYEQFIGPPLHEPEQGGDERRGCGNARQ